jgi:uncharacterized membrane protein YgdD (TMEM256/DUF423 family)
MINIHPRWTAFAALLGALAVALGAFGAHGLQARFAALASPSFHPREIFDLASRYHAVHALALLFASIRFGGASAEWWANAARWAFLVGIAVFSGSLYAMAVTGAKWLGMITPIGGVSLIAGWTCLALAGWKGNNPSSLP